jgi:hypothetical protein
MTDVHSLLLPLLYSGLNTPRHGTLDDPASTAIAWPRTVKLQSYLGLLDML